MTQLPIAVCWRDLRPKLLPALPRFQALIESMLTFSWAWCSQAQEFLFQSSFGRGEAHQRAAGASQNGFAREGLLRIIRRIRHVESLGAKLGSGGMGEVYRAHVAQSTNSADGRWAQSGDPERHFNLSMLLKKCLERLEAANRPKNAFLSI
jgi:hypothetical protein